MGSGRHNCRDPLCRRYSGGSPPEPNNRTFRSNKAKEMNIALAMLLKGVVLALWAAWDGRRSVSRKERSNAERRS